MSSNISLHPDFNFGDSAASRQVIAEYQREDVIDTTSQWVTDLRNTMAVIIEQAEATHLSEAIYDKLMQLVEPNGLRAIAPEVVEAYSTDERKVLDVVYYIAYYAQANWPLLFIAMMHIAEDAVREDDLVSEPGTGVIEWNAEALDLLAQADMGRMESIVEETLAEVARDPPVETFQMEVPQATLVELFGNAPQDTPVETFQMEVPQATPVELLGNAPQETTPSFARPRSITASSGFKMPHRKTPSLSSASVGRPKVAINVGSVKLVVSTRHMLNQTRAMPRKTASTPLQLGTRRTFDCTHGLPKRRSDDIRPEDSVSNVSFDPSNLSVASGSSTQSEDTNVSFDPDDLSVASGGSFSSSIARFFLGTPSRSVHSSTGLPKQVDPNAESSSAMRGAARGRLV